MKREPHRIVENAFGIHMLRWVIHKNRFFRINIHKFLQSDEARALHDHPWAFNVSILIKGNYYEHRLNKKPVKRKRFIPYIRIGKAPHRVELINNKPVYTIFINGNKIREWGFLCPQGWKHWKEFTTPTPNGNAIGPGCDET